MRAIAVRAFAVRAIAVEAIAVRALSVSILVFTVLTHHRVHRFWCSQEGSALTPMALTGSGGPCWITFCPVDNLEIMLVSPAG